MVIILAICGAALAGYLTGGVDGSVTASVGAGLVLAFFAFSRHALLFRDDPLLAELVGEGHVSVPPSLKRRGLEISMALAVGFAIAWLRA